LSLHRLIHKGTAFRYHGSSMNYSLSLGLFSSNDIDAGSRMLLKTLSLEMKDIEPESLLDIGCGIGTLAISLKKRWPQCRVTARDRDALACSFTRHNSQVNKIQDIAVELGLFLEDLQDRRFDLIVSNIPAKAGERVISHFLSESVHYTTDTGRVAVVVVSPLRSMVEERLNNSELEILFSEHSKMYSVYHFRKSCKREAKNPGLALYFRHKDQYMLEGQSYPLTTVYNLPDFDQVSWKDSLAAQSMKGINRAGTWLLYNPGQGHYPLFLISRQQPVPQKIILVSRDLLQLKITAENLRQWGYKGTILEQPLAIPEDWKDNIDSSSIDFFHGDIQPVIRSDWEEPLKDAIDYLVKPGAIISLLGRSSDLQNLMKSRKGSTLMEDRRSRGWRSVILKKNPS